MGSAGAPFVVRCVLLPSGDVCPCSPPAPEVEQTAAALAVTRCASPPASCADLDAVVMGAITDHAGDPILNLILHRRDPRGRSWSYLAAVRLDLPDSCRRRGTQFNLLPPFLMRLVPLLVAAEGSAMD